MSTIGVLEATAERIPDSPAYHQWSGGEWSATKWSDHLEMVRTAGRSLVALGVERGSGVSIIGRNRPEWFVSYLGAMCAGAIPSGLYTTNTESQCEYIVRHSESVIAFVEGDDQLGFFLDIRRAVPKLKYIVLMEGRSEAGNVLSWAEFLRKGEGISDEELASRTAEVGDDDLATLIYTSGTTGPPKAVMLNHRNLTWTAGMISEVLGLTERDRMVSYLPLSHIAEQILTLHTPLRSGNSVWFVSDIDRLGEALLEVRPTVFLGVPRVWEKIQAKMKAKGAEASPIRKKLVAWARRVGLEGGLAAQERRKKPWSYPLADWLVYRKVREQLGLDQARMCVSSAAPASIETLEFFLSLGIPIDEVYGMSECTGPTTMSMEGVRRIGKTGTAAPGTEVRTLEDGEILIRGPHVFMGYYKDEKATRAVLDEDGWLHSGDVGEIDADGFIRITDRKKDLIITAGGHNVSPQNIEKQLQGIEGVSQAVVIGDRRSYLVALLTLDRENLRGIAQSVNSGAVDIDTARQCPRLRQYLKTKVDEVNKALARSETIKKFEILSSDFDVESGELTPTMKIRRRVVAEKYGEEIEQLYSEP